MPEKIRNATDRIAKARFLQLGCRVSRVSQNVLQVASGSCPIKLGDLASLHGTRGQIQGEVTMLIEGGAKIMLEESAEGVSIGALVSITPPAPFAPDDHWLGRVIDPDGNALDGRPLLPGRKEMPRFTAPPMAHDRQPLGKRIDTGFAVFNTVLPLVVGQRVGLFAGSGVGKSTLLADFARSCAADVVVLGLVGERGRELRHFVDDVLGKEGLARSVVVAATSDQSAQKRYRCGPSAMAVAEYFRDQGKHVLLLMDSLTRFCEAQREMAAAAEEPVLANGFPATTPSRLASLCERAGPGAKGQGKITAIFTVLVAGSDMEEPVADMVRGLLDGHFILSRQISERGRFPAIDVLRSVSRSLTLANSEAEMSIVRDARRLLARYDEAELMIQSGLYVSGSDPDIDKAINCFPSLEKFCESKDGRGNLAHFAQLRKVVSAR